jgi:hypothetical protein
MWHSVLVLIAHKPQGSLENNTPRTSSSRDFSNNFLGQVNNFPGQANNFLDQANNFLDQATHFLGQANHSLGQAEPQLPGPGGAAGGAKHCQAHIKPLHRAWKRPPGDASLHCSPPPHNVNSTWWPPYAATAACTPKFVLCGNGQHQPSSRRRSALPHTRKHASVLAPAGKEPDKARHTRSSTVRHMVATTCSYGTQSDDYRLR